MSGYDSKYASILRCVVSRVYFMVMRYEDPSIKIDKCHDKKQTDLALWILTLHLATLQNRMIFILCYIGRILF